MTTPPKTLTEALSTINLAKLWNPLTMPLSKLGNTQCGLTIKLMRRRTCMKNLTIKIDDDLYNRLDALCTHHGHKAFLIREAIAKIVTVLEQDKKSCAQSYFESLMDSGVK